jgi:hypothetical protein
VRAATPEAPASRGPHTKLIYREHGERRRKRPVAWRGERQAEEIPATRVRHVTRLRAPKPSEVQHACAHTRRTHLRKTSPCAIRHCSLKGGSANVLGVVQMSIERRRSRSMRLRSSSVRVRDRCCAQQATTVKTGSPSDMPHACNALLDVRANALTNLEQACLALGERFEVERAPALLLHQRTELEVVLCVQARRRADVPSQCSVSDAMRTSGKESAPNVVTNALKELGLEVVDQLVGQERAQHGEVRVVEPTQHERMSAIATRSGAAEGRSTHDRSSQTFCESNRAVT